MTKYLMSVYYVEGQPEPAPEVIEEMYRDVDVFNNKLMEAGAWVFGGGLHTPDTSTVVSSVDGETLITDGPFPEAKEQIGGFWIIEAPDLDDALAWASEATVACRGPVEVRPFQPDT
jgi:hypothetical protein